MSMELMLKEKSSRLVSITLVLILITIGLIALTEKGIPRPQIPVGTSPLSPLSYGTSVLYQIARSRYNTIVALDIDELNTVAGDRCVYIVISPSYPITWDESKAIVSRLLQRCGSIAIFIADEEPTSNALLQYINSSIRVLGNRIVNFSADFSPYPKAFIVLNSNAYIVVLDLASEVVGGMPIGVVHNVVVIDNASSIQGPLTYKLRAYVASVERISESIDVVVIGDGSIFLNQVLNSNETIYIKFANSLLDFLCSGFRTCTIIFDAMHSSTANIRELDKFIATLSPQDLLYIFTIYILTFLHPSIWLPPALATINKQFIYLFREPILYFSLPLLTLILLYILRRGETILRDEPLTSQRELELYIAPELRKAVIEERVRLTSNDFINLYTMVDTVFKNLIGMGLDDNRFSEVVGRYAGVEKSFRYWRFMNKYYRRALRKSIWPPLVLWRYVVRRAVEESESILNSIGSSILQYTSPF